MEIKTFLDFEFDIDELRSKSAPLYCRYASELEPQTAYIEIDCRNGAIDVGYYSEIGNAVPVAVAYQRARRYSIPANVSGKALAELLESSEFLALAERIYQGVTINQNGGNFIGRADDDAQEAEEELRSQLHSLNHHLLEVWDVDDWLFTNHVLEEHWYHEPLRLAVENLRIAAEEESVFIDGDLGTALLDSSHFRFRHGYTVSKAHVDALLAHGMIGLDESQQWREQSWRHLPDKQE